MADNTQLAAGAGGDVIATDDIAGVKYQRVKVNFGADGAATDVAAAAPLPVQISDGTDTALVSAAGALQVDGSGVTQPVSLASVPSHAVTNAGTFAVQATVAAGAATIGKAEDVASADADVGVPAMAVRKATPANTSGLDGDYEMLQMSAGRLWTSATVDAALPAGTNAIGKLAANSGVDIGDVDVTSIVPGTGATNLGKAEDAAHSSGDVGVMALTVRQDTAAALAGTDGDYQPPITDASGRLHVNVGNTVTVASHAVTNAGTFAVQVDGNALTSLQLIDDPVIADDAAFTPATSKVMMAGFEADETSTDSVDEGDAGAARMTLDRKQIVTLQPHTAGGLSTAMFSGSDGSSILVATAQAVKASAGQLYGYYAFNPEAAVTFVHFYNTAAASVTVGTTNPLFTIAIPAGSAANLTFPYGVLFSNAGWSVAATTTAGGTGAPATGVSLVVWYM